MSGSGSSRVSGSQGNQPGPGRSLEQLRSEHALLRAEWERRFTLEAFKNPTFVDVYLDLLQKRQALGLFEALYRVATPQHDKESGHSFQDRILASVIAIRSEGPPPPGGVPVSLLAYLERCLSVAGQGRVGDTQILSAMERVLTLGNELLDDPALSGFRIDILGKFHSTVTTPLSVVVAPGGVGAPPESLPGSTASGPILVPADPEPPPEPEASTEPPSAPAPTEALDLPAPPEPPPRIELQSFVGMVFRGYKVIRVLGRGGFGAVFLAEHPTLPVKRALKFFLDVDRSGPGFENFREQCLREARLQSTLKHENILEVVDAFEDQGYVILVMEFIDGPNLGHLIADKNRVGQHVEPLRILDIMIPVAKGLAFAHSREVVHRDLKPENILLDRQHNGVPKIADFGLARTLEVSGQRHHTSGDLVGTPTYMAPEQVVTKSSTYDKRCDIYSLGIVLYQLAMGVPPFSHEDPFKIFEMHEKEPPEPISLNLQGFPEELDRIILCCLEKRPEDRFSSAEAMLQALETCKQNLRQGITTVERQPWERRGRSTWTRRFAAAAVLLLVLGLGVFAGSGALRDRLNPPPKKDVAQAPNEEPKDPVPSRKPEDTPRREAVMPTIEDHSKVSEQKPTPEPSKVASPPASDVGVVKQPLPEVKKPEPKAPPLPLREQILRFPIGQEEQLFASRLLDVFSIHRGEMLARQYEPLAHDLDSLTATKKNDYTDRLLSAAREMVRLADELVSGRRREFADSKGALRLGLSGGGLAEGRVEHADNNSITLIANTGAKTTVHFDQISSEEFIRDGTLPVAEVAYQALSGDAGKALPQALRLADTREQVLLWYPVLARLARLEVRELAKTLASKAESPLARGATRKDIVGDLGSYSTFQGLVQAMNASGKEVLAIYPYLPGEFEAARRDAEALELLLDRSYSRVTATYPSSEASPTAATLLLAGFIASLEEGHDDLIAKRGWINYNWELRPDPGTQQERLLYWDVLDGGGCLLRDPGGPRNLIMGRPHPRPAEGLLLKYDFEPLGEQGAAAEWRLHLKREGGQNSYLRFDRDTVSLWPFGLGGSAPEAPLASAKLPHLESEPATHTCVLIPAEGLHVFVDGRLVTTFAKEDALIPSQLSLAVLHAKLSARSIQVKRKQEKSEK